MNHKQIRLFIFLMMACLSCGLAAQESVVSAGGNASDNMGSVNFSVGQAFYNTASAISGSVAEVLNNHTRFRFSQWRTKPSR